MSKILYIAPFYEKNGLANSSTNYVKGLAKKHEIVCRPIGKVQQKNDEISQYLTNKPCDNLIIHSYPDDFMWDSRYNCIGITHLKSDLIQETNYKNKISVMNHIFHDGSFQVEGFKNIRLMCQKEEYIQGKKTDETYRFLIHGSPTCYEEVFSGIRAYLDEFRAEENVELHIKMPENANMTGFRDGLNLLQSDCRKYNNPVFPPVHYLNIWFNRKDLLDFYNKFDCIINCSIYNKWSRPVLDFGFLGKRCISLIDEPNLSRKMSYGASDFKDYPRGQCNTFSIESIRKELRTSFNQKSHNYSELGINLDDFTKIPQELEEALI